MTEHKHVHIKELGTDFILVKGFPKVTELVEWLQKDANIYFLFPAGFKQESTQLELHSTVKDVLTKIEQDVGISYQSTYRRVNTLVLSQVELGNELEDFEFERACDATIKGITPKQPSGLAKKDMPSFG